MLIAGAEGSEVILAGAEARSSLRGHPCGGRGEVILAGAEYSEVILAGAEYSDRTNPTDRARHRYAVIEIQYHAENDRTEC